MIDFTNAPHRNKSYSGAERTKLSIIYNNEQYMLKFPTKENDISCLTEYISCMIFKSTGIPVQYVLLGTYTKCSGKVVTVVACKDFAAYEYKYQNFASLKNLNIDSKRSCYDTDLNSILSDIEYQNAIDSRVVSEWFWDMFIVDALICNPNRNNANWGFLYNTSKDELLLAPVCSCGASLFPEISEEKIQDILSDQDEFYNTVIRAPTSAIKQNGKRINYLDFITSCENNDCCKALKRIKSRINMKEIYEIIDASPMITEVRKQFLKEVIKARNEIIINHSCI